MMKIFLISLLFCLTSGCRITIDGAKYNPAACNDNFKRLEYKINQMTETLSAKIGRIQQVNKCDFQGCKTSKCPIEDVAYKKTSQQSSTYSSICLARHGNDGNKKTFTATKQEWLPYWWVDLGHVYDIKRIEIFNRFDGLNHIVDLFSVLDFINIKEVILTGILQLYFLFKLGERLHDLDITIGPTLNDMALCIHYKGPGKTNEHLIFRCHRKLRGRFVKLSIKGREYLQMSEVKVYAPLINC
ncbi:uncharacterized protein LOC127733534 [Mytilus californianus]|uniref:uncharacterized protein LOC127733534 n=1 Tax=Mytilus californianus TaxID=6549 RepID=UPI00224767DA|nr:uncharacterized protein LOC127733534 [Mytilus californianus]